MNITSLMLDPCHKFTFLLVSHPDNSCGFIHSPAPFFLPHNQAV